MYEKLGQRKIRLVNRGNSGRRLQVELPEIVLEKARIKPGDIVRISVSRRGEIRLTPLRPEWPELCGRVSTVDGGECGRRKGHAGDCIADAEVPF